MIKRNSIHRKNESAVTEDPREILLSLVDMGSIDIEEAFLACVKEMSDAECKRILNSLSLPTCTDSCEEDPDEDDFDVEDLTEEPSSEEDSLDEENNDVDSESFRRRRLEHRISKLEHLLRRR